MFFSVEKVMNSIKVFFRTTNFVNVVLSTFLTGLIRSYIQSKPSGLQTILDLLIKDSAMIWIAFTIVNNLIIYCGLLIFGQFEYIVLEVVMFVYSNILTLLLASVQITNVVQAILIFKGEWLYDIQDSSLLKTARGASVIYTIFRFMIDFNGTCYSPPPILKLLTNKDFET